MPTLVLNEWAPWPSDPERWEYWHEELRPGAWLMALRHPADPVGDAFVDIFPERWTVPNNNELECICLYDVDRLTIECIMHEMREKYRG